jgi:hypothetical protein
LSSSFRLYIHSHTLTPVHLRKKGHYYFFNVETKTSAWSLDAGVIGVASQAEAKAQEDRRAAEAKNSDSSLPQIQNLHLKNNNNNSKLTMVIDVEDDGSKGGGGSSNKPGSKPVTPASPIHPWQSKNGFKCGSSLDGSDGASLNKRQYLTVSANTPTGQSGMPTPPASGVSPLPSNSFKRVSVAPPPPFPYMHALCQYE